MRDKSVVDDLVDLGVGKRSDLMKAAKRGEIAELRCEMEVCFHPDPDPLEFTQPNPDHPGRWEFDARSESLGPWEPSADHFPELKKDGGKDVRLGHRLCNRVDWSLNPIHAEAKASADAKNAAAGTKSATLTKSDGSVESTLD